MVKELSTLGEYGFLNVKADFLKEMLYTNLTDDKITSLDDRSGQRGMVHEGEQGMVAAAHLWQLPERYPAHALCSPHL